MLYERFKTQSELNYQLLVGLKKHLLVAQDTTQKKHQRLRSLDNLSEVLEYVVTNINEAAEPEERALLQRFFLLLLTRVKTAIANIHHYPQTFAQEIAFINVLIELNNSRV